MLYIVATPIGNLEDISMRALRILGEVDLVLCEDTRMTKRLLDHYDIDTECMSYHQHTGEEKTKKVLDMLKRNKDLALVSDAGTPGISDPGGKLVARVFEELGDKAAIESVPGPSAVTAALSISGIPTDKFVFMGFPPHKKGRSTFLKKIFESEYPVVVYESKHRIVKFLEELKEMKDNMDNIEDDKLKKKKINLESIVVCRELSKMHETTYRGGLEAIIEKITSAPEDQKGEFVVVIS